MKITKEALDRLKAATLELLAEIRGRRFEAQSEEGFAGELRDWLEAEPEKLLPWCERNRGLILRFMEEHGLESAAELPEATRDALEQHSLMLAGSLFTESMERIKKPELCREPPARRIMEIEKAIQDVDRVVEYLAHVEERERKQWLRVVMRFRDDCSQAVKRMRAKL